MGTATIVNCMCILVYKAAKEFPKSIVALDCHCIYETESRAKRVDEVIGPYHISIKINIIITAILQMFLAATGLTLRFYLGAE